MDVELRRITAADANRLAEFLAGEEWLYHTRPRLDRDDVLRQVSDGYFESAVTRTFWIMADQTAAGLVRLFDVDDGTPLFDLRLRASARGRGIGQQAVRWLTAYLFTELPSINRVEGTTRADNHAMRRLFRRCGYVKEAHYRQSWPGVDGSLHDTVGYAILRADWLAGTVTVPDFDDEQADA